MVVTDGAPLYAVTVWVWTSCVSEVVPVTVMVTTSADSDAGMLLVGANSVSVRVVTGTVHAVRTEQLAC